MRCPVGRVEEARQREKALQHIAPSDAESLVGYVRKLLADASGVRVIALAAAGEDGEIGVAQHRTVVIAWADPMVTRQEHQSADLVDGVPLEVRRQQHVGEVGGRRLIAAAPYVVNRVVEPGRKLDRIVVVGFLLEEVDARQHVCEVLYVVVDARGMVISCDELVADVGERRVVPPPALAKCIVHRSRLLVHLAIIALRSNLCQVTDTSGYAANWYPDPWGRAEHRYFDGTNWTEHVASHGRQSIDPPGGSGHVPTVNRKTEKVQRDVTRAGIGSGQSQGGGSLFTEPVLVVNQKAKLIEINQEFAVYDQHGVQIGAVRQVGQSAAKKVLRFVSNVDQYLTHKFQVVDVHGQVLLALTRPAKLMKSRLIVEGGDGQEIGQIVQQNVIGKIRFSLEAGGQTIGSLNGENWRAWNFNIQDHTGKEVARITKTWEGLAKTMFTTADNYVVQIHESLPQPLHSLVVASALGVDTALKQDAR
jgi:uncharacterized protein YxjI